MKKIKTYSIWVVLLATGFGVGHTFSFAEKKEVSVAPDEREVHAGLSTSGLTNPLLECDLGEEYISNNSIRPFRDVIGKKIEELTKDNSVSHVSYYFRDLNNGSWFGFKERETFSPASLLKVPLLMYILREAEKNSALLDTKVPYKDGIQKIEQVFVQPESAIEIGKTYTVRELLEHMIVESDNGAASVLLDFVGPDRFSSIFRELLALDTQSAIQNLNNMSVRDYAAFFRILFNASYLQQDTSEEALRILARTRFTNGIVAGLPDSVVVAHKFGERESEGQKQLHDCGIVYKGKTPYVLCIMTRGSDYNTLARAIGELSRITYEQVDAQERN